MSEWRTAPPLNGHIHLIKEEGKVRIEVRETNYRAWLWSLGVEVEDYGWSTVVSGVARTQQVAKASAQLAADGLEGNAKTMAE